jgi:SAM-dependent methyltransferase
MNPIFFLLLIPAAAVAWLFWTETKGAGWQPAPASAIKSALKLARVERGDTLYDLGAGDGRVLIAAAKAGARAIGIELDPLRYLICRLRLARTKNAHAIRGDIFDVPLSDATVVFIYLRDWSTERLKRKFATLKRGTRIVTYYWPVKGWQPVAQDKKNEVYVYRIK